MYTIRLESLVAQRTEQLRLAHLNQEVNFLGTILAMVNALEASDIHTKGHLERVMQLSLIIGQQLEFNDSDLRNLRIASILHDIGKIGVYHSLLHKTQKLTEDELLLIRQHPNIGANIIEPIDLNPNVRYIISQHHERIDSGSYPNGLSDEEISVFFKIVAIAVAYDAMTSGRFYREVLTHEEAYYEIKRCIGSQFDPDCADAFLKVFANNNLTLKKDPALFLQDNFSFEIK